MHFYIKNDRTGDRRKVQGLSTFRCGLMIVAGGLADIKEGYLYEL